MMSTLRTRALACVVALSVAVPALAQSRARSNEHWVTTWATAVVARAQQPAGGAPGGGPRGGGPVVTPGIVLPPAGGGRGGDPVVTPGIQLPNGDTPGGGRAGGAAAPGVGPGGPPAAGAPQAPGAAGASGAPAAAGGRQGGPGAPPPFIVSNQTLRQIVHTSTAGNRVRVVLSNAFGTAPVEIGAARVALRTAQSDVMPQSVKRLTFSGSESGTILPGAILVSDPADLAVPPTADLAIDLFLPGAFGIGASPLTTHQGAAQTNYVSAPGNHAGEPSFGTAVSTSASWFLLARVEVTAANNAGTIVTFGDSITDGTRSTPDTNGRWPDHLARRLAAERGGRALGVANLGIAGNRVLGDGAGVSALARFDRDVLMQTGVTHVVVMEAINDIGQARSNPNPSAADLIAAHQQMIERAHAQGVTIIGATLTPFEGAAYFTPEGEAKRQALNQWIRTSGAYDGVIDFDMITRDPAAPTKFLPAYDSGDHLHPNDAGYKAMGEGIDLKVFR